MSVQSSGVLLAPSKNLSPEVGRRCANFHPSIWGDHFLSYASEFTNTDDHLKQHVQQLKEEVRKMLMAADDDSAQKLLLIDAIQRLGVAYHFESEIDEVLKHMFDGSVVSAEEDVYTASLRFRLLRQQGYHVSCDLFNNFKDNEGNFKESLSSDVRGMLSLYEATHFRVHGEDILDEALAFTTTHLQSATKHSSNPLAEQVVHALKQPIRKGLPRLEARHYFSVYQADDSHNKALLKLAKLDFNLLQKLHQKELSDISAWWKDLDFAHKLPFARDRVVECYFWILGVYFEPQFFFARRILTKVIAMTSIIDDIYDVYGTLEELELFTEAVERWDISAIDQLPEYMRVCYQALLYVYSEIEEEMAKEGRSYRLYYAKEAMKNQVRAYYEEAKWLQVQQIPTMEEYMPVALVTSAYSMLATTSFVGMGDAVTKESFDWIFSKPKIVRASAIVCRLMDDMVFHKFEQKRGHVASAVECYMKQHGASEQETPNEFPQPVREAWKDINEECLIPTAVPMPILMRVLNLARVIDVIYKNEDGYTHFGAVLKDFVTSMLIDPVPI
ncbi:(-)-germacrene D synthase [Vitis vinifera]|uniref:(-)-germacrene D synthase n=1 Tax=Vitis vinifera TaxID=29760 RepID=TPSGD_VITVI|nr:(-)-germacrene D synthase [Vitis vinifera]Q6Q3H3.1 RecName: Full=(-)-germacrene D synthase [Vitis vinifera]AAS66357.1 (-)-germacrene D synthase [Vitis vinifera]|eukprot:NP_001268213.1 (-)-germacrene D synthase [Vitis vinifera]